ncbi:MAG TPA: AAA family ATPase [Candidatus Acidoferrales bacterium]|nr:AAA family ATPase [Candidatus Acidoferrales bacterium]
MAEQASAQGEKARGAFVGRDHELAELRAGLSNALTGRGRLFLVTGEPGIGKTRLAEELARESELRGARVAWGRCWEGGGAPAYWPFVQVLRTCLAGLDTEHLIDLFGAESAHQVAHDIGQMLPDLRPSMPPAGRPQTPRQPLDPAQARFRIFQSVATVLANSAHIRPLVVILDDLHEADEPSVQMLKFVARELTRFPALAVVTYRDAEMRQLPDLSPLLADLARDAVQIPLSGLGRKQVALMVESRAGMRPGAETVSALYEATAGNPLFVEGVLRVLIGERALEAGAKLGLAEFKIPDNVREVIRRRIAMVSVPQPLGLAAVIGNEFSASLVGSIFDGGAEALARSFDEAVQLGILAPVGGTRRRFRFAHALIRTALYDDLPAFERGRVHLRIAQSLETRGGSDPDARLAELAHHYCAAGGSGDRSKAIDYSIRAGDAANAVCGFEDAIRHWQAALELMDDHPSTPGQRAQLLERVGRAMLVVSTDFERATEFLERALRIHAQTGDAPRAAALHLTLGTPRRGYSLCDPVRGLAHLKRAEELLKGGTDRAMLGQTYVSMAVTAIQDMRSEDALSATDRAIEIAEQLDDETFRIRAAAQRAEVLFYVGRLAESFALAEQVKMKADEIGDFDLSVSAGWSCGMNYFLLSDPDTAQFRMQRELSRPQLAQAPAIRKGLLERMKVVHVFRGELNAAREMLADRSDDAFWAAHFALAAGDWERAAAMQQSTIERSHRMGIGLWRAGACIDLGKTLWLLNRETEAERAFLDCPALAENHPAVPFELEGRARLATFYAATGRADEADGHLRRCREILGQGEDWRGTAGLVACAEGAVAAAQGRFEDADNHFAQSVRILSSFKMVFEQAEALFQWGRASATRDPAGSQKKFDAAIEIYRRCGAGERWIERATSAKREPAARFESSTVTPTAAQKAEGATFHREGAFWTLSYRQSTVRLKDTKGLRYIALLLANPGRELAATDLVQLVQAPSVDFGAQAGSAAEQIDSRSRLGDAGELLDAKAKSDYRRRLIELRVELDEAERMNDVGRVERARGEIESISEQLSAALGLGGRDRKAASHSERARSTVTKRIKSDLRKIQSASPALARVLDRTIRTGGYCAYVPDPERPVVWTL